VVGATLLPEGKYKPCEIPNSDDDDDDQSLSGNVKVRVEETGQEGKEKKEVEGIKREIEGGKEKKH
jgi:hypothetical protein